MNEQPLMKVREDFMISPTGDSEATLRMAHFLKPISNSIHEPSSPFGFNPSSLSYVFDPNEWSLKFHFNGWRHPQEKWIYWVDPFIGDGGGGGGRVGATDGVEGSLLLGEGGEKK
ncbi:hypothetical protein MTR_7g114630 [Medicago truncatula]|uniref:Uncharacterized protein n=1 Tax=Medicago truncatula TaxID=3880 RepID=G7L0U4_MEDTR|nr:hypothetical protein MTR_7g114630 [Medicago truncatula]